MDAYLFFLINHGTANPLFDVLMPFLSHRGYLLVLPFLVYVLYRAMTDRGEPGKSLLTAALWAMAISVISVIVGGVLESFLKTTIARIRPCHALESVRLLSICIEGYSMPSGHAISSFAFATPLFYLTRKYVSLAARWYPLGLAALIAFSRVYVGVHYPSDIVVGALLGAGTGMLLGLCLKKRPAFPVAHGRCI
jgi:membrane-associated phospholipid phosphatase